MDLNRNSVSHISLSDNIKLQHITNINLITLEHALPFNYNYVIDSFEAIQALNFLGAFSEPFETKFHVNIYTVDNAKIWLEEFSELHKITLRETQGRIIKGVRFLLSKRFHCAHSHMVKLKQGQKGKNNHIDINDEGEKKSEVISTRKRDTDCSATLSIQLQNKSNTHPCIISLRFHHNHPFSSSHALSFRPILEIFDDKENILPESSTFVSLPSSINKTTYNTEDNDSDDVNESDDNDSTDSNK
ncbi:25014_t:CDS:2, partial [Gigaspora rosea]